MINNQDDHAKLYCMPILNYHEVHIWSTDLTLNPDAENIKFLQLNEEEQKRALQFKLPLHKTRFIAAHAALRSILSRYLNQTPETVSFAHNAFKKPFLNDHPEVTFNLSHSHNIALIALTRDNEVGVDVEMISDKFNPKLVERYFHPEEIAQFDHLSGNDKATAFFQLWTRKEALLKAAGTGLHTPLNQFNVSLSGGSETILLDKKHWHLQSLTLKLPYLASLATANPVESIQYYDYPS